MSWAKIKLASLLASRPKTLNPAEFPNEMFELYSIPAFDRRRPEIVSGSEIRSAKQILYPGDVLLSKIVPHIRRCWVVGLGRAAQRQIGSGEWIIFRGGLVYSNYLSKILVSDEFHQAFMRTVAGVGGSLLRARPSAVAEIEIPLPPLEEQKRIAVVLDKADVLRLQRQESLELSEKLIESLFIEMFVRNPAVADWKPRTIEWMAKRGKGTIRTGPFGSQLLHSEFLDRGIAVLGIDNAVKNRFEWGRPRFISPAKYRELKRYKVFPDDLIITIMGTLGRCAIVPKDIPEAINTKHLCCITLDHEKCIPEFLHACLLNHPTVLRQLGIRRKGAVMPGLNMGIIKDLELPLPPMELQHQFKRFTGPSTAVRTNSEESQKIIDDLFGALQQRAFRGELDLSRIVLDSPSDSPPSTALEEPPIIAKPKSVALFLEAPQAIEATLKELDATVGQGEPIPWSADYFKYRVLGAQPAPFSFSEVVQKAESIFTESPYEEIKDMILELLGNRGGTALLTQSFDLHIDANTKEGSGRKEIVFGPAA